MEIKGKAKIAIILIIHIFTLSITLNNKVYATTPEIVEVDAQAATDLNITSKSAILILIFDAINEGKISYEDLVTTSEYAKSMGGSQVFLETGEQQTVETMIKCIVVVSGNDTSVCRAEHIAGSEAEFVNRMNERAKGLGMTNTVFKDCCGLSDSMEHHTTARDVAIMSRELIAKYLEIQNYTKIWMENITHVTVKETKEFTLANTNKLLKQYQWATGLKTGSTSLAKYCLSATARKDDIDLIAVIMAAPDYKARFAETITLLNYGYSVIQIYRDSNVDINSNIKINGGIKSIAGVKPESEFVYICGKDEDMTQITKKMKIEKKVNAPAKAGEVVGEIDYYLGETQIGKVNICLTENVERAGYMDYLKKMWYKYMV